MILVGFGEPYYLLFVVIRPLPYLSLSELLFYGDSSQFSDVNSTTSPVAVFIPIEFPKVPNLKIDWV